MELQKIEGVFNICKINNIEQVDFTRTFTFLSKTNDEISVVCEASGERYLYYRGSISNPGER